MKSKLTKFLLALGLTVTLVTGCGSKKSGGKGSSTTSSQTSSQTSEDPDCYYGDDTKVIEDIPNTPCTEYSAETLAAIRAMYKKVSSSDNADEFVSYMLTLKVGDQLAREFATWFSSMYDVSFENFALLKVEALDSANFERLCYKALALIKAFDMSGLVALFNRLNADSRQQAQKEYDELTIFDMHQYDISYGDVYYGAYKKLQRVKDQINDAELTSFLQSYEQYVDNFHWTEEDIAEFNARKAELKDRAENGSAVPATVISFFEKHGQEMKDIVVTDLKAAVDGFLPLVKTVLGGVETKSRVNPRANGFDIRGDYTAEIRAVLQDKDKLIKFLRLLVGSEQFDNLLLDGVTEILIPEMRKAYPEDAERLAKLTQFENRIKALSAKHVRSLVDFVLKLVDKVSVDDLTDLLYALMFGGMSDFDFIAFGQKYISAIDDVVASITGEDKTRLLETSAIFGINVLEELSAFTSIFKNNEPGSEQFFEKLQVWLQSLMNKFNEAFISIFAGGTAGQGGSVKDRDDLYIDDERMYLYVEVDNWGIYQGDEVTGGYKLYVNYQDREHYRLPESSFYGNPAYFDESFVQRNLEIINEWGAEDYQEEIAFLNGLSMSVNNFRLDTSSVGRTHMTGTFTFVRDHETFEWPFDRVVTVRPREQQYLRLNYIYNCISSIAGGGICLLEQGKQYEGSGDYAIDTSTTGWHVVQGNHGDKYIYYVASAAEIKASMTYSYSSAGVIMNNNPTRFYDRPYLSYQFSLLDGLFENGNSKSIEIDQVSDFSLGNHTVTVDGYEFEYVVLDYTKPDRVYLNIDLTDLMRSGVTTMASYEAPVQENRTYGYTSMSGMKTMTTINGETGYLTITNYSLQGTRLTFTVDGVTYTYRAYNYYY